MNEHPSDDHPGDEQPSNEREWRLRSLRELVTDTVFHGHEQESAFGSAYLLAHFDRDWEHYGLVQTWDRFEDNPRWEFSLWYWGADHELAEHLCDFPHHRWDRREVPWVEAATIVAQREAARRRQDD